MYKDTFKMVVGDTIVGQGLVLVGGQEKLRQNTENRLPVNLGEWSLNTGLGLNYKTIGGRGVTDENISFAIWECYPQDDRAKEAKEIKITRQARERRAKIDILIIDKGQEEAWFKEMMDLG